MTSIISIISVALLSGVLLLILYNGLVKATNIVEEAYSAIDVHLKKRFSLIPNLVEVVKGYNKHESETLQKIVEKRVNEGVREDIVKTIDEDRQITGTLKNIRILVEDYPELKANTQFTKLMDNLSIVENDLAMARRYYNGTCRDYNTKCQVFPGILVAKMFNFQKAILYKLEEENERSVPEMSL